MLHMVSSIMGDKARVYRYDDAWGPQCDPLYQSFLQFDKQMHARLLKPAIESSQEDLTQMHSAYSRYTIIRKELDLLLLDINCDYFCDDGIYRLGACSA